MMLKRLFSSLHRPIYEKRIKVLTGLIAPYLRDADRVLDVGCGTGRLGEMLRDRTAQLGTRVEVCGLEKFKRGDEPIPVTQYSGGAFPFPDRSFDAVMMADVLHHESDPEALLRECIRISRRLIIIKDHQIAGFLAYPRICLIDWAANAPYGVKCLFRYHTQTEWRALLDRFQLDLVADYPRINLYPPVVNWLFGRRLQCLCVTLVKTGVRAGEDA